MDLRPIKDALHASRASLLTLFSILFSSLMAPIVFAPTTIFFLDAFLYLVAQSAMAVGYFRVAHAYYARFEAMTQLQSLREITYELMSLFGGGFFTILCGWITLRSWREEGALVGDTWYVAIGTVIFLGAVLYALSRFVHYLRQRPPTATGIE